ncbi:MAG TPA: hypothetical protein VGL71_02560 [Urbifossiella sp.]
MFILGHIEEPGGPHLGDALPEPGIDVVVLAFRGRHHGRREDILPGASRDAKIAIIVETFADINVEFNSGEKSVRPPRSR